MTTISMDMQENAAYVEGLLKQYGFRNVRRSHNGFTASCPFHGEDRSPSFSINRGGLWMCFSCKAKGNLKHLHKAFGGGDMDWQESLKAMGVQLRSNQFKIEVRRDGASIDLPSDFLPYTEPGNVPPEISKRLGWDATEFFGLGRSDIGRNKNRCVIPIRFKDKTVGYHSRALSADLAPRYYNPAGFDIKCHVFNYDSCTVGGEVILVEGAFNAMSMWEKGMPNVLAVFGTQFTAYQLKKILSLNPASIVICFDRDSSPARPGQKAAKKLGMLIQDAVPTYIMPLPIDKDPNDLSAGMLARCYEKRVPYERVFGGPDEVK